MKNNLNENLLNIFIFILITIYILFKKNIFIFSNYL